ncbi:SPFH domain-containing protein, partial [Clostridioides difficile]
SKQVAETKTFLELLQNKTEISQESYKIMKEEFQKFNLELEEVLIDTPKANGDERILALIEQLADRQLAKEQVETYEAKKTASAKEREYRELQSKINEQDNLTSSEIHISIEKNNAEAEKAVAEIKATQNKIEADSKLYIKEKEVEAETYRISEKAKAEAESIKAL